MPTDEPQPPRARIILPGQDPDDGREPSPTDAPDPPQESRSRIILPPGVARDETEEIPEYPKLRPLMIVPFRDGEKDLLVVSDPLGVMPGEPVLAMEALGLMQLFDGQTSVTDITAALMQENKDLRIGNVVKDFVAQLDELLMLESPRFEKVHKELRDAYHALEIRQTIFDGKAYPSDAGQLRANLDAHFEAARERAGHNVAAANSLPRALAVPHLDPRRAGAAIAQGILQLDDGSEGPVRVIMHGTGHALYEPYALTRKHYATPLGRVETDVAFVDALASALGDDAYRGELAHRDEHSIEFTALYLKHLLGDRVKLVPILVSGFHALFEEGRTPRDDPQFEAFISAVRSAEANAGGRTVHVAAVDLSHVGPRFGDPATDDRVEDEVEAKDRTSIEAAVKSDADAWYGSIADHQDSTRICGFGPTYTLLRCAEPGAGRLLNYERSAESDTSFVSIATIVWP